MVILKIYKYKFNDEQIEKTFNEINNIKINNGSCSYKLGILLEKNYKHIHFTSYTICDGICIFNHKSVHKLNKRLIDGSVNLFDHVSQMKNDLHEGKEYIDVMLDELILNANKGKFKWNIII